MLELDFCETVPDLCKLGELTVLLDLRTVAIPLRYSLKVPTFAGVLPVMPSWTDYRLALNGEAFTGSQVVRSLCYPTSFLLHHTKR